jgi:hypothetical protein
VQSLTLLKAYCADRLAELRYPHEVGA